MTTIINDILEMLNDDMVDHGFLAQYLQRSGSEVRIADVLEELLTSGKVEIGIAIATPGYVEFVAWKGCVAERISRAMNAVAAASGADKDFAYWLALRENVDRFEGEESVNPE
jgi:hypothetical protein